MRTLSSNMTFIFKFVLSVSWIGIFSLFTVMMFLFPGSLSDSTTQTQSSKWLHLIVLIVGPSIIYLVCMRLKTISIDKDEVVISNYRKEIRINISDVEKVTGSVLCKPELIWLHLNINTKFGDKIQFMGPMRFYSLGLSYHPLVSELNQLIRDNDVP